MSGSNLGRSTGRSPAAGRFRNLLCLVGRGASVTPVGAVPAKRLQSQAGRRLQSQAPPGVGGALAKTTITGRRAGRGFCLHDAPLSRGVAGILVSTYRTRSRNVPRWPLGGVRARQWVGKPVRPVMPVIAFDGHRRASSTSTIPRTLGTRGATLRGKSYGGPTGARSRSSLCDLRRLSSAHCSRPHHRCGTGGRLGGDHWRFESEGVG